MVTRKAVALLQSRGHDAVLAVDGEMAGEDDFDHLTYASQQGLIMVTFDKRFAGLAMHRADHQGLICLTGAMQDDVGGIVRALADFAESHSEEAARGHVFWLK